MIDAVVFDLDGTLGYERQLRRRLEPRAGPLSLGGELFGDVEAGLQTAARDCNVPFLHSAYGFGRCATPDHAFPSFAALTEWLLNHPPAMPT